ncbi:hypothetical protein TREES_T100007875 [Tupaia chinensis]|uniref:Uncharacterized protein n=1 Tax=Tupaia chinensis TaxID=246437 RepID=L9JDN1_TUPCH|nr:hypothetical protein TREES_T100007875 [Tupaia chinensis]
MGTVRPKPLSVRPGRCDFWIHVRKGSCRERTRKQSLWGLESGLAGVDKSHSPRCDGRSPHLLSAFLLSSPSSTPVPATVRVLSLSFSLSQRSLASSLASEVSGHTLGTGSDTHPPCLPPGPRLVSPVGPQGCRQHRTHQQTALAHLPVPSSQASSRAGALQLPNTPTAGPHSFCEERPESTSA